MAAQRFDTVLFDLGAVLVDWNPRYLYRQHFNGDDQAMERFLAEIAPPWWNLEIDGGKTFDLAVAERSALHPQHAGLIALWRDGWEQMLRDEIAGSVEILSELRARGHKLHALTNWSAETFPVARRRFGFLEWFQHIVVSGEVGLVKPDPRIFALAIERCALDPARTIFIDDNAHNVEAGRNAGMHALHFQDPGRLRSDLVGLGVL
ncbi:MAG TPA: HAD family phosphatase [Burkholderiales bacterium]|nr:HAD family phosphatase [Burkholderiales bacterium]